jgi:hypothetical protein
VFLQGEETDPYLTFSPELSYDSIDSINHVVCSIGSIVFLGWGVIKVFDRMCGGTEGISLFWGVKICG